ncbi:MAG: cyclic nucleotide-binding domain-containing protein [bacterium]
MEDTDKKKLLDAFEPVDFKKSSTVIKEGDDGDFVYVVYSGTLSCSKNSQFLKKYNSGDTFGELALLYNAPRAATIVADTDSHLYRLDRESFNYIVKGSAEKKRAKYE